MLKAAVKRCSMAEGVDWRAVAAATGRTTKQCRERWMNVLDPSISRAEWSAEEIHTLFNTHAQLGNKWAAIAARLPGRPETAVKNTFYGAIRREERRAWAASSGQPIPPPFHAEVPHVPRVAAILAEMGLVLQPVSGGRKGSKASAASSAASRKRTLSLSSCEDVDEESDVEEDARRVSAPAPKRVASVSSTLKKAARAAAVVTVCAPAPVSVGAWSVDVDDDVLAVEDWLIDTSDASDAADLPSVFDVACELKSGACDVDDDASSVSADDAATDACAWSLEFDVADHAALFGDESAFAHPSERGMVDTDALFSPRAPREFSVPADFSWFVGM